MVKPDLTHMGRKVKQIICAAGLRGEFVRMSTAQACQDRAVTMLLSH
jgi:hypothetical protein